MKAAQDNTSYSPVAAFIGAAIMACFLWAVGNYVIYQGFYRPEEAAKFFQRIGT